MGLTLIYKEQQFFSGGTRADQVINQQICTVNVQRDCTEYIKFSHSPLGWEREFFKIFDRILSHLCEKSVNLFRPSDEVSMISPGVYPRGDM